MAETPNGDRGEKRKGGKQAKWGIRPFIRGASTAKPAITAAGAVPSWLVIWLFCGGAVGSRCKAGDRVNKHHNNNTRNRPSRTTAFYPPSLLPITNRQSPIASLPDATTPTAATMTKVNIPTSSASGLPPAVSMEDYHDWTARKAASYGRVLENALAKIKKEAEVASYSNLPLAVITFKDLFQHSTPSSEWEWDPKIEVQTRSLVTQKFMERKKRPSYGSAFRRKGIDLQPQRPSPPEIDGAQSSIFNNYRQNPTLRKHTLLYISAPSVRPHYTVVLQHSESILKPKPACSGEIPSLMDLSARAFGRAIVMGRDPADLEGDSKWYAYCDENSLLWRFLGETVRGHIIQLLVEALGQDWFPEDLACTIISQCVNAGDVYLAETFFHAAYRKTYEDATRSVARRRGELAPDPWTQILYMPDVLYRQLRIATDIRCEIMTENWFRDVLLAGASEIGSYMEIPGYTLHCLELFFGIETWESGLQRRRLNRSGKQMRKKRYESFKQGWLFQAKDLIVYKAARTAEDLVARLFEVGWKDSEDSEHRLAARDVMGNLVQRMIHWSEAYNHPIEELAGVTSRSARTVALCAVLTSAEDLGVSAQDIVRELVELLLVIAVENPEAPKTTRWEKGSDTENFDIKDLADDVCGVMKQAWDSFDKQKEFMELLLGLAVEDPEPDVTKTPIPGDKSRLLQKRQSYLLATFAYHLATSIAESSKSDSAQSFATKVEQTLVGMKIWRGGLLKASELKTPKFSNLVRDLALTDARNSGWRWEPMLNDWVEGTSDSDGTKTSDGAKVVRRVSRKLFELPTPRSKRLMKNTKPRLRERAKIVFTGEPCSKRPAAPNSNTFSSESDSENSDYQGDSSIYPNTADTTMTEPDIESPGSPGRTTLSSFLLEVCIPLKRPELTETPSASRSIDDGISDILRQSGGVRNGMLEEMAPECNDDMIVVQHLGSSRAGRKRKSQEVDAFSYDSQENSAFDVTAVAPPRKRGRPRKNPNPTIHVQAAQEPPPDSAYEPDGDDEYEDVKHQSKRRMQPSGQLAADDRSYWTRTVQKREQNMKIYQDELDLTSSTPLRDNRRKRWSIDAIILKDADKSKLNEKLVRERRKSGGMDVIMPGRRGRPRTRVL
ncbi:hypothetical protein TWF718_000706 [Orbilia javanica]|uniref:Uncharacterized protein n=1 Tax=Orbilia javanica TaxID=47235 RepID=A0AAN8N8I1_9PEZI